MNSAAFPVPAPAISVLLPVYNAGPYLPEAIESLLNQTFTDFEIIIVNDCSTDNSGEIIQGYKARDDRIVYVQHASNQGVSTSRNSALDRARGEFIALMDADDICNPERFRKQLDFMVANNLDVCGSFTRRFGAKSRPVHYPLDDITIRMNLLCYGRTLSTPSAMIRKSAIGPLRYRSEYCYGEDYEFWVQIMLRDTAARFGNIPEQLIRYRKHSTQASRNLRHHNRDVVISVVYRALRGKIAGLDPRLIELHYKVLKEKHRLTGTEVGPYSDFLLQLPGVVGLPAADIHHYWFNLCNQRLRRNIQSWRLCRRLRKDSGFSSVAANLSLLIRSVAL